MRLHESKKENRQAEHQRAPSFSEFYGGDGESAESVLTHHKLPQPTFTVPAASWNAGK